MNGKTRFLILALVVGLVGLASGCFGVTQNPARFPFWLGTGDIIRTHAKPPGIGYFRDFDPSAVRLEVRPLESTNPVQTQHVILATIYDANGKPRRKRRVEWLLEGVGNIVEVDESGYMPGRGYKVDNRYAVSYTDFREHRITRGNDDPNDDFVVRPGQTWCVITSAVEGDTYVTVYAPEIANWDHHKVFVTKHWVDAEWEMPPPAVNRAGTEHVFTTRIFRHTNRQPLANYRVRYRILDGPPAVLLPSRTQEAVVVSDLDGNARVTLAQVAPAAGVNRLAVEIIRPPDPCSPSGAGIVIGQGETAKEWVAPVIAVAKMGPQAVAVGQEVPYTITVSNTGKVEVSALTVRDTVPEGLQYLRSEPPATVSGNQLVWTLPGMQAGQSQSISVTFRATRPGPIENCVQVVSADGERAETCTTTNVTTPQLQVAKTGPAVGVLGQPVTYQITVTNPGNGPATGVILSDSFDPGLEHDSRANPVELQVGTLAPGETKTFPLVLTPRQVGRLVNRVQATADGGLVARAEHPIDVARAQIAITKTGPTARYVDRPAVWDIVVSNPGDVPLENVVVRDQLPAELQFVSASDNGLPGQDGVVVWNLGTLQPQQSRQVQLTTRCAAMTPRAVNVAVATADPGLRAQAEAPIEIRGIPAFRLEVVDVDDPIEVGARTQYRIDVTNQGSMPGDRVEIVAIVPPQMRILGANGPAQPRFDGQRIVFPPVDRIAPKQTVSYSVDVEALQAGDLRFRVELRSETLGNVPVIEEESTNVYASAPGAPRPAAPGPLGPPAAPNPPR